jgi:hypothetical protein
VQVSPTSPQLRTVLKEPTAGEMEDALVSLSRNLPEAFEETIARIQRLPESRRRLGINTLMWICHAKRTLTVFELSEALSVRHGQTSLSQKHCPSPSMIIECCQGLVILDSETRASVSLIMQFRSTWLDRARSYFSKQRVILLQHVWFIYFSMLSRKVHALKNLKFILASKKIISSPTLVDIGGSMCEALKQIEMCSSLSSRFLLLMMQ